MHGILNALRKSANPWVCVTTHLKNTGDLQFWRGNPQGIVDQDHSQDGEEHSKVTDDGPHLVHMQKSPFKNKLYLLGPQ